MELRIGVFLPHSDMFPKLSLDFLNGIKLPFKLSDTISPPKYIVESIGNGTEVNILERIEKMLLQEDADVIVCFCSFFILDNLVTIANTFLKPILHITLGARVLKKSHVSPYLVHQSLNLCHTSYLSGKYCVENYGRKVALLSSFYDGGYHMAEAFYNGVVDHGGDLVYNYVSPLDYQSETFQIMVDGIKNSTPDVLFLIFSYNEAKKIMDVMFESNLDSISKLSIPMMLDESILKNLSVPYNYLSIASWAFEDKEENMQQFCKDYNEHYSSSPNIFGLLGYEVGSVLIESLLNLNSLPQKIGEYLKGKIIQSPRGELSYNNFNESIPKNFKIRKIEKMNNEFQNWVVQTIESNITEVIYDKMEEVPNTGWKNPYICT